MSAAVKPAPPVRDLRVAALRRFALAITVLNSFGHTVLGFETSWAQVVAAVGTTYFIELALEMIGAWNERRRPAFVGSVTHFIDFMLPAHITGLAISMLLYGGDRVLPFVFAAVVAIASKALLVAPVGPRSRHFLNPSNTGLVATSPVLEGLRKCRGRPLTRTVKMALDVIAIVAAKTNGSTRSPP